MSVNPATLQPANIVWRGSQPFAPDYDDIYFSEDAAKEVQRVFITPSCLPDRLPRQELITVGELGFGTGLNFLVTADEVLRRESGRLHFISCEAHPLNNADWQKLADLRGHQWPLAKALATAPLALIRGWHRRVWAQGRITLSVYHGEAQDALKDLIIHQQAPVDAWFLDGFTPEHNAAMWDKALFAQIAQTTTTHSTVTTFTAAGRVRRALTDVGFNMRRVDQRPHKRESLAGQFADSDVPRSSYPTPAQVTIHGAGISGASVARHCAEAGITATVYDPNGIANGASSMDTTLLHARLLADGSTQAQYREAAFHYASHYVREYDACQQTGVLQVHSRRTDDVKLNRVAQCYGARNHIHHHWIQWLGETAVQELSGRPLVGEALWFPSAATVNLRKLCLELLDHPNIQVHPDAVADIPANPVHPHIICTGSESRNMQGLDWLEITDIYGQLDRLTPEPASKLTRIPIVGNGYLVPSGNSLVMGATYEYTPWSEAQASEKNFTQTKAYLDNAAQSAWEQQTSRQVQRGARCVSSDRHPIVGQVSDQVWISTGHGSMGTTSASLAASTIVSLLQGWIPPVSAEVYAGLSPERFAQRQARRGRRHL